MTLEQLGTIFMWLGIVVAIGISLQWFATYLFNKEWDKSQQAAEYFKRDINLTIRAFNYK